MSNEREGGRLLVDQLVVQGAECAFTVPGESFLAALSRHTAPREAIAGEASGIRERPDVLDAFENDVTSKKA